MSIVTSPRQIGQVLVSVSLTMRSAHCKQKEVCPHGTRATFALSSVRHTAQLCLSPSLSFCPFPPASATSLSSAATTSSASLGTSTSSSLLSTAVTSGSSSSSSGPPAPCSSFRSIRSVCFPMLCFAACRNSRTV